MSIGPTASIKGAPQDVLQAIQSASRKTGVDFNYLVDQARAESGFRSDIKASTSSATGLYQFIESTWLATVKAHGAEHGLAAQANKIQIDFQGRHFVADPQDKREILNLRKDPAVASLMAAEFASDNQNYLEAKTGRDVNATDLYFAHFLGAGGASRFLSAMDDNPSRNAAALMPKAAAANKNVFYHKDGSPKSLAQVYDNFDKKFASAEPMPQADSADTDKKVSPMPLFAEGIYRVDPQFSRFYSSPVNDFIAKAPSIEPLKGNMFTSLFNNSDVSRMQNQVLDPVSFLILTGLDTPK